MPLLKRRKFYRILFFTAGIYNICWGLLSAVLPQWLFAYAKMPLDNHPQIFACLGMVVGLYGVVYFEVARVPERSFVLALVGFVGKILGPIGLAQLILSKTWPPTTIVSDHYERSNLADPVRMLSGGQPAEL